MVLSHFVLPVCFCLLALAYGAASVDTTPPVPTAPANNQRTFWEWVEPFMPAINSTMRNIWPPIDAEVHKETTTKIVTQTMDPLRLSLEKVERDVLGIKTTVEATNLRIDKLHSNMSLSFETQDLKMEKIQLRVDQLHSNMSLSFEKQDLKMEKIQLRVDKLSNKVDSKFESLSEKINSLSEKIDSLSDSIKSMKTEISMQNQLNNQQLLLMLHMIKPNTPATGTSESPLAPPLTIQ